MSTAELFMSRRRLHDLLDIALCAYVDRSRPQPPGSPLRIGPWTLADMRARIADVILADLAADVPAVAVETCGDAGPRVGEQRLICVLPAGHAPRRHLPDPSWRQQGWAAKGGE